MMSSTGRQSRSSLELHIMRVGALWAPDDELQRKADYEFPKVSDYEIRNPVDPR